MTFTVVQEVRFEAAHHLPHVPAGHKCRRLHGHSYICELYVAGPVDPVTGWVIDFGVICDTFAPLHAQLDHHCLNDIPGLENPTSENLASWIWQQLAPRLPGLTQVVIQETCCARCILSGDSADTHR
jgi:6-pyruvoyltetrahydropterin/6-carboxytetrahydropterin synthase